MIDEHNHHGLSSRKALAYTGCSRNFYYYKKKRPATARRKNEKYVIGTQPLSSTLLADIRRLDRIYNIALS
jgi:hypothetical protein